MKKLSFLLAAFAPLAWAIPAAAAPSCPAMAPQPAGEGLTLAMSQLVCGAALALWYSWEGPASLIRRLVDNKTFTSPDSASRGQRGAGGLPG